MKKIVIAADSFKGSASTIEVENYIEQGIRHIDKQVEIVKIPIADGGEGTVDSLVLAFHGEYKYVDVIGPSGNEIRAKYGMLDAQTAIIEMAEASGLHLVSELNPFKTTTYGTGQLIKAALDQGAKTIYVGLGGSATNDGGVGMAQALGASFRDKDGKEIGYGADGIKNLETIDVSNLDRRLQNVEIIGLSDVTNPLCGKNGASHVYGPQKGATEKDVEVLDRILAHYGNLIKEQVGIDIIYKAGAGAAGGLGAGLMTFCNAHLEPGITKILDILNIESHLKEADLVITGEGKIDSQSLNGKAPVGVAKLAKKYHVPVIAIVGSADYDIQEVYNHGIDLVIDTIIKPMSLDEAISNVGKLLMIAAESAYRAFQIRAN